MGRWAPGAEQRLAQAAMELFSERGYEQTTVAEIAARAGVTERTFFRYFADKREVLFSGSGELEVALITSVRSAPPGASPIEAVAAGLAKAAEVLEQRRAFAARRQAVIAANPELQERELAKMAAWAAALTTALRERDVAEPQARVASEVGVTLFRIAFEDWVAGAARRSFPAALAASLQELRGIVEPVAVLGAGP